MKHGPSWFNITSVTLLLTALGFIAMGQTIALMTRGMAAGKTPATGAMEPSNPNSPNTVKPARASDEIAPIAAIRPSAIGRS